MRVNPVDQALSLKHAILTQDSGLTVTINGSRLCVDNPGFDLRTVRSGLSEADRATASAAATAEKDARQTRLDTDAIAARVILRSGAPATWTDVQKNRALKMCLEHITEPAR